MLQNATISFLKSLTKHNNKPWFEENRGLYESAKEDFQAFIGRILEKYGAKDEDIASLTAKDCLFRINRDVRFSKDKSPYKNNMGASMSRGGKKSPYAGYYFHLEPGKSFVGGGMWSPEPEAVKKIRQEIDYCFDEFNKIISGTAFKSVYGSLSRDPEMTLVNLPKGYEKDNPAAEYLKLKSWVAMRPLTDQELQSESLVKEVVKSFSALQPMISFINRAIE